MLSVMCLVSLGLVACSGTDDNGPFDDNDLTGTYVACAPPEGLETNYQKIELSFSGNNFTSKTNYYSASDCSGTSLGEETSTGTFSTSGNNIDYAYTGGVTIYDIYQVNGLNLRVGDRSGSNNGLSPETRPTGYEESFQFSKQ